MTNKEAIEVLKEEWRINAELFGKKFGEALELAINALDKERPQGNWKFCEGVTTQGYLECSVCEWLDFRKEYSDYCPNC